VVPNSLDISSVYIGGGGDTDVIGTYDEAGQLNGKPYFYSSGLGYYVYYQPSTNQWICSEYLGKKSTKFYYAAENNAMSGSGVAVPDYPYFDVMAPGGTASNNHNFLCGEFIDHVAATSWVDPQYDTLVNVDDGTKFAIGDTIQAKGAWEVMIVTGVSGNALTVYRGVNNGDRWSLEEGDELYKIGTWQ